MIKTHKPRGHIWSNASAFQQTKEYRSIEFEECVAPQTKVLVRDPDGAFSESERLAKRKRVEKLADDFLNGVPLFISSAQPCPQSVKSTIVWNKRSSDEPKFVLPQIDLSDGSRSEPEVWADVESDAEILQRLRRHRLSSIQPEICEAATDGGSGASTEEIEAEQARVSCGRVRRLKTVKISSGPSEDALRQAAALRTRRLRRANSDVALVRDSVSFQNRVAQTEVEPRSEPSHQSHRQNYGLRRTSHWLSRRKSLFTFAEREDPDESIDELQFSRIESPLEPFRRPKPEPEPSPAEHSDERDLSSARTHDRSSNGRTSRDEQSVQRASYHTAPEQTEAGLDLSVTQTSDDANVSRSASRKSPPLPMRRSDRPSKADKRVDYVEHEPPRGLSSSEVIDRGTSRRAHNTAQPDLFPGQQRRVGPIRATSKKQPYGIQQPSQNESTPLLYRKGRLRPREACTERESATVLQSKETRRRDPWRTPNNSERANERLVAQESAPVIPAVPPTLDMSFEHDSSFAPNLNMALVDEHLNSILPTNAEREQRASALKRAIQRELRNSGAEISRCTSEPPTSSQAERPLDDPEPVESAQEKWAGTQFLLNQAQRDLVTSPKKQNMSGNSEDQVELQKSGNGSREDLDGREPLKQLSQEPMPSTQQLLGDFEGWSTVKKPRAPYRSSPLPTPTATGKSGWTPINMTEGSFSTSGLDFPRDSMTKRPSSLRFSTASAPSPQGTASKQKPNPRRSSPSNPLTTNANQPVSTLKSSDEQHSLTLRSLDIPAQLPSAQPTEDSLILQSFTSGPAISSYQAAQPKSGLLRDPSDLSEAIEDLTKDILCTEDLEVVLSQFG